ncbi:serine/threonine-protein kinase [Gordonia polyisoprenivorans]|uniref:serine/threonine-protein kinase n=1 Tax=Gordonia polyisoprenivorans TaxID=84595 RepID=UPI00230057BE|nr:serine/threonine-protein kinase [Gordonia polyisoprenivorans]WCB38834.1 serine/threonine-protein kinase [Gordonia polyisoprenivorans]
MHDPADRSGSVLGDYTLQRLLGRGAMGEVYEARDSRRGRTVALKLLSPQFAGDSLFRERFLRESRMAAQLSDPHVIPIHDWGEIDGFLFLDMRIVAGGSDLRKLLGAGPLAPDRAVSIIEQIAHALDTAHAAGLVHRDVKPDNILIDSNDFAYLVDFGLAQTTTDPRLTDTGAAVGSFAYMAPERFGAGNIATPATDIYALTCVLVECLTGSAPFGAGDLQVLVAAHLNTPPPMLHSPFDAVVARGMAKNPAERFVTAGELAQAATDALEGRIVAAPPMPSAPSMPNPPASVGGVGAVPAPPAAVNPHVTMGRQLPPVTYIPPVAGATGAPQMGAPQMGAPQLGFPVGPQPVPHPQSQAQAQVPPQQSTGTRVAVIVGAVVFLAVIVIVVALLVALT